MRKFARVLFWICVSLCGALGVVHTLFTFYVYSQLTPRALYFAGTGLAAIVLALFNIAIWHGPAPSRFSRQLAHFANALMAGFGFLGPIAVPEPQAYIGTVAISGIFFAGLLLDRATAADARREHG